MPAEMLERADPGAPFVHGDEPAKPPVSEKTDAEKRFEALENSLTELKGKLTEAQSDARYWADRAQRAPRDEADDEPPAADPAQEEVIDEDPEAFLDDISKRGLAAIKARGFVSKTELAKLLKESEERSEQRVEARVTDGRFDAKLAQEFPEIVEDAQAVAAGKAPKSELYKRTGEIYREAIADDPRLKGSKSALLLSARQAKAELAKPARRATQDDIDETPAPRRAPRRERIAEQMADTSRSTDRDADKGAVTGEAREVMGRLGVSEEAFIKNRDRGDSRRGR